MNEFLIDLLVNLSSISLKEFLFFVLSPLVYAVYKVYSIQKHKNLIDQEIFRNNQYKDILIELSFSLKYLNSSIGIILRCHNGEYWLNGKSMLKLSLYDLLSINQNKTDIYKFLNNIPITLFSSLINNKLDIIPIDEIKNFYLYPILSSENFKYLLCSPILNSKKNLSGLVLILLKESPAWDRKEFLNINLLSKKIGNFF
jgi:hypothetical protein